MCLNHWLPVAVFWGCGVFEKRGRPSRKKSQWVGLWGLQPVSAPVCTSSILVSTEPITWPLLTSCYGPPSPETMTQNQPLLSCFCQVRCDSSKKYSWHPSQINCVLTHLNTAFVTLRCKRILGTQEKDWTCLHITFSITSVPPTSHGYRGLTVCYRTVSDHTLFASVSVSSLQLGCKWEMVVIEHVLINFFE